MTAGGELGVGMVGVGVCAKRWEEPGLELERLSSSLESKRESPRDWSPLDWEGDCGGV